MPIIDKNDETKELHWFALDAMPELAFSYPEEMLRGGHAEALFESCEP